MRERDAVIDVDDARLRMRIAGDGPAVLFIHGWALDLDMWRPQFAVMAERYRLIAFDRRGFGLSSGSPSIDRDIADVEQVLNAAAADHAAVVGMSQGARIAIRCARSFPERVTCIVLDGAPGEAGIGGGAVPEVPIAEFRQLLKSGGIAAVRARWLQHPFMRLYTSDPVADTLLREIVGRYPGNDLATEQSRSQPVDFATVTAPALLITGEHDSAQRRVIAAELSRALPNAQRAVIAAAGHLPNFDRPVEYNRRLHEFFCEHMNVSTNRPSHERSTHHAE